MDNGNILQPLFNTLAEVPKSLYNLTHKLPKLVYYEPNNNIYYGNKLILPLGISKNKKEVVIELSTSLPFAYIVGTSGSGKSTLLRSILSTVVNNYKHIRLILLDYKLCELSLWSQCNNVMFAYDPNGIDAIIEQEYDYVLSKYNNLMNNRRYSSSIAEETTLIIVEEVALMPKATMKKLTKLFSICRNTNTYGIITTQRPSANEVLTPQLKALIDNRIVLRTNTEKDSVVALGTRGAEQLKGNGHAILSNPYGTTEFQSYMIEEETLRQIINSNSKPNVEDININDKCKTQDNKSKIEFYNLEWIDKL